MEITEVVGYQNHGIVLNPLYVFTEDESSTIEQVSGELRRTENPLRNDIKLKLMGWNDSFKTSSDMYESYEATLMVSDMEIPGVESMHEGTQMPGFSYLTGILVRKRTQEQFFLREGEN